MQLTIGIQPDYDRPGNASSPIWRRCLEAAGHTVREVDVYRADILEQLQGCHGFMWRHAHYAKHRQVAARLFPVLEHYLGLVVYPDAKTAWHYDDKIAQAYLFEALGIPAPRTWVWFDDAAARRWAANTTYPLVLKLWGGASSQNVRLVRDAGEACEWIDLLFERGVTGLTEQREAAWRIGRRRLRAGIRLLFRGRPPASEDPHNPILDLHRGYVLLQEFLPDNAYDTRVTVIGDRAFGFRRCNRDDDFRASGSGRIVYDPEGVAPEFLRLAFDTADRLGTQSCAIDGLWRGKEAVVGEVSYTYVSQAVYDCPGHWDADLNWHEGHMWPEEAQAEDFLVRLNEVWGRRAGATGAGG